MSHAQRRSGRRARGAPGRPRGCPGRPTERRDVRRDRPEIAACRRTRQGPGDAERLGVAERLLDERQVDPRRPLLVEPEQAGDLADRVEQRNDPARREHRRRVVGRLRPGRQADRNGADRLRHLGRCAASSSSPSMATVAPGSAARARSRSANATSGWNAPACVPAAIAGRAPPHPARRSCGPSPGPRTAGWTPRRRIASSGTARITSSTSSTRALASANPRAPSPGRGIAAGGPDRGDATAPRASRPGRGRSRAHPDGAGADDADDGPLAGRAWTCGCSWSLGWSSSPWRCWPGGRRVERDALGVEVAQRLLVVGVAALGRAADHVLGLVPRPHRAGPAARAAVRAVRFHATSVASGPRAHPHRPIPMEDQHARAQRIRSPASMGAGLPTSTGSTRC